MLRTFNMITVALAIVSFSNCTVGKQGVYLAEMPNNPVLIVHQDTLYVKVGSKNSFFMDLY